MATLRPLPLEPPPADDVVMVVEVRSPHADAAPPAKRGDGSFALVLVAAALVLVAWAIWNERPALAPAQDPAASAPATAVAPTPASRPSWPRGEPAAAIAAWQPGALRFADGSAAVLYPDRVRAPYGRPVRISVERFDAAGNPMRGVLDMEMIVDSPGQDPFKLGFTEVGDAPGTYATLIPGDRLGIGRTDFQLIASQSARPGEPIALASAVTSVEVVGGVRFAGPPTARRDGGRLVIDLPVSTRTATHATVRAELHAGGALIAELTGEADLAEGDGVVTLDAGPNLAADDPRASTLVLVDGGVAAALAGEPERWTDFWRGARSVTQGGKP